MFENKLLSVAYLYNFIIRYNFFCNFYVIKLKFKSFAKKKKKKRVEKIKMLNFFKQYLKDKGQQTLL